MTKKKRHDPSYTEFKEGDCMVKCSCGRFMNEYPTRAKAEAAWSRHYRIELIKEEED